MVVQKLCLKKVRVRIFFQNGFHYVLAQLFYSKGGIDEYQYIVYLNVPTLYGTFLKNDAVFSQKTKTKNKNINSLKLFLPFCSRVVATPHTKCSIIQWGVGIGPTCFKPWRQKCFEPFSSFIMFSRHKTHF
jgi:hypothetical protein